MRNDVIQSATEATWKKVSKVIGSTPFFGRTWIFFFTSVTKPIMLEQILQ